MQISHNVRFGFVLAGLLMVAVGCSKEVPPAVPSTTTTEEEPAAMPPTTRSERRIPTWSPRKPSSGGPAMKAV